MLSNIINDVEAFIEKQKTYIMQKFDLYPKEELYYVYAYAYPKVYVTRQNRDEVMLLEGVTDEFKKGLAEGYILRFKNNEYTVDEELTDKSMRFELDFDNYSE